MALICYNIKINERDYRDLYWLNINIEVNYGSVYY